MYVANKAVEARVTVSQPVSILSNRRKSGQKHEASKNHDRVKDNASLSHDGVVIELASKTAVKTHTSNSSSSTSGTQPNSTGVKGIAAGVLSSPKKVSLSSYLYTELTRGYWLEHDRAKFAERRKRVYTFITIPRELEKFITFGFFQCLDGFLYVFTFLPLRFMLAFIKLCIKCFITSCGSTSEHLLQPAEICDLLKVLVLVACCMMMSYIDVSMMYHIIRGQTVIKLYIFFNMLDVADKLFSSFGQDVLDALFWTATEPRGRKPEHFGVIPHLVLAIVYVFLHSILVLFQANTLNVAFNSHNKTLLIIMMSNNFTELKGCVFKKFEKNNLFQMSCSDVRERFHLLVLLAVVGVRNLTEFSWNMDHLWLLVPDMIMVMVAEFFVDWVKHAFITKFNEIHTEVYHDYTISIAYDIASSRQTNAFSDHLDVVSRRMGFIPLPIAVLLVRVIGSSLRLNGYLCYVLIVLFYLCLATFKILNSIVLLGIANGYIKEHKLTMAAKQREAARTTCRCRTVSATPSKDDLDLLVSAKSSAESSRGSSLQLERSQSMKNLAKEAENDSNDTPTNHVVDEDKRRGSTGLPRRISFMANPILCNSTVSLKSMCLNEEFMNESKSQESEDEEDEKNTTLTETPRKESLADVQRYTMVNNRII